MTDDVNNPEHYNQQGIEVIDVIEAYNLPYHLGNVIKYVLRHEYKGQEEKDLRKAQWYLNRYIEEAFDIEVSGDYDGEETYSLEEVRAFFLGFDFATDQAKLDEVKDTLGRDPTKPTITFGDLPTEPGFIDAPGLPDSIMVPTVTSWPGTTEPPDTFVHTSASRIAGDTDTAREIKDEYYGFNGDEVIATCDSCGKDITGEDVYLAFTTLNKDYCSYACYRGDR
jgi:hypothetical protein